MSKTLYKWTVEDYHRLIETGILCARSVELLAGEIVKMSPEGPIHAHLIREIADYLRELLRGRAYVSEAHPITLADSEPEPDVAIVRLPREQYRSRHPKAADIYWLIEVAGSSLDYDREEKKSAYANAGIPEFWIVNIQAKSLVVYRSPALGTYSVEEQLRVGTISPLAFSDVDVDVETLLRTV